MVYLDTFERDIDCQIMKTISCLELGGCCEATFRGETFEEVANQSQLHAQEMMAIKDQPHMQAMAEMMAIIERGEVDYWLKTKMELFALLPNEVD